MNRKDAEFIERRRQLLRLGAAGVPMVLTLRASAAEAVHSALDCSFVLTKRVRMLVDHQGRVWVGDRNIRKSGGKLYVPDISTFKNNADYVFPSGSAPSSYRPDECPEPEPDPCASGSGDDDDYWGASGSTVLGNAASDTLNNLLLTAQNTDDVETLFLAKKKDDDDDCKKDDDDDDSWGDDDDSGDDDWTDCDYALYKISANTTITPADYLGSGGSWSLSGSKGLYLALAGKYLDSHGNDGGFPGISCLLSILNYLDTSN